METLNPQQQEQQSEVQGPFYMLCEMKVFFRISRNHVGYLFDYLESETHEITDQSILSWS